MSEDVSQWSMGGPAPEGRVLWSTPENRNGATQWLGELLH
jgi:hypothetical protein